MCVYRYTAQLHAAWQMAELKFLLIVKSSGLCSCSDATARNIHLSIQYERGLGSVSAPVNYNSECNAAQRVLVHFYLDWLSMWTLTVIIRTRIAFVFCVYELQWMQVVTKLKNMENNCAFCPFLSLPLLLRSSEESHSWVDDDRIDIFGWTVCVNVSYCLTNILHHSKVCLSKIICFFLRLIFLHY